jgi:hypothetical protein
LTLFSPFLRIYSYHRKLPSAHPEILRGAESCHSW